MPCLSRPKLGSLADGRADGDGAAGSLKLLLVAYLFVTACADGLTQTHATANKMLVIFASFDIGLMANLRGFGECLQTVIRHREKNFS